MFLLVASCHVDAYLDGHRHGVSVEISINLSKKVSLHISHKKNCCDMNLGEGVYIFIFFLFSDSGLYLLNGFDYYFDLLCLNGVTLKTSN